MNACVDLFIVFYSGEEFGRLRRRNMWILRGGERTQPARLFPLWKGSKQYILFIGSNVSTRVSSSGTRNLCGE